jgi:hypothetical protein
MTDRGPWRGRCIQDNRPGQNSHIPISNRRSLLSAASTQGNAAALPRDGENLTEISTTLSTGYKTAANIVPVAKLTLRPALTLVKFLIE